MTMVLAKHFCTVNNTSSGWLGYLECFGHCIHTWTFKRQITIFPREKYSRLDQVTKYLETVDFGMSDSQESTLEVKAFLNHL